MTTHATGSDGGRGPGDFPGTIGSTVAESVPWWPPRERSGGKPPNVVVVVLDDVGFAQLGCYGASIRTPHMDALASGGLRYSNFHVTALCSTTRACLLTGRNHHSVGVGFLSDFDTGFPSYRGAVTTQAATLAEMLAADGYGTYMCGKWHLTPPAEMCPSGPFTQWPTQRGFDRYYGFLWGEDDQWTPEIWYDQHRVDPPSRPDYHLSEDLVDRSQEFLSDHLSAAPDRPFFLYLAFGACHAPHQAPPDYLTRYRGSYEHGWDAERERVLARQVELGIVPQGTDLAPRNPGVPAWDEVTDDERALYARMQEVFAGFMEHTDDQIGRLVAFLREYDALDDTVVLLMSDNGASGEGGRHGTANEYRYFLGTEDSFDDTFAAMDELGSPMTHNHYPAGWAQAGNTPLKFYKKYTYGGGVRAPLIVHWPSRITDHGAIRPQFHHAIDLVPTILTLTGADAPTVHRGVEQLPVHGTSMEYTLMDGTAPSTRTAQYFETTGYRGVYRDGMKAVTAHEEGTPYDDDVWELYDLREDFSETHDLSEERPEEVAALVEAWWDDARTYGVLPLDDRMVARVTARDKSHERTHYELLPGVNLPTNVVGPNFSSRLFSVVAEVELDDADDGGVLLAYGRRPAGFSLFVQNRRLVLDYNLTGRHTLVESDHDVPVGVTTLAFRLVGQSGEIHAQLLVDGRVDGKAAVPATLPGGLGCLSTQCGHNSPSAVSARYTTPFRFEGRLKRVVVDLDPVVVDVTTAEWDSAMAQQ